MKARWLDQLMVKQNKPESLQSPLTYTESNRAGGGRGTQNKKRKWKQHRATTSEMYFNWDTKGKITDDHIPKHSWWIWPVNAILKISISHCMFPSLWKGGLGWSQPPESKSSCCSKVLPQETVSDKCESLPATYSENMNFTVLSQQASPRL